jgi:hypothetical protein
VPNIHQKGRCDVANTSDRSDPVAWDDEPPTEDRRFIPIVSPKPDASIRALIVGHKAYGVWTHFLEGKTHPCTGNAATCQGCIRKISKRWKGYIGVYLPAVSRYAIAEITAEAVRHCPALTGKSASLRGRMIRVYRNGRHTNAPCRAEIEDQAQRGFVPPDFDVPAVLLRVWSVGGETVTPDAVDSPGKRSVASRKRKGANDGTH